MKKISLIIPEELHQQLLKVAQLDNRSLTYVVNSFLQKALKEKNRKHVKKQVHSQHNSSN
jgi:hypothetical protein